MHAKALKGNACCNNDVVMGNVTKNSDDVISRRLILSDCFRLRRCEGLLSKIATLDKLITSLASDRGLKRSSESGIQ